MEEKVTRESKQYIHKLFKQYDKLGSGAIHQEDMKKLLELVVQEKIQEQELNEMMLRHVKRNKYNTFNPKTKQMEVHYQDDSIDFPSCMAIAIHFLTKFERRESNAFSGQCLIRFSDFDRRPSVLVDQAALQKKRLF